MNNTTKRSFLAPAPRTSGTMFPIVRDYSEHMASGQMARIRKAKLAYDSMNAAARKQIVDFRLPSLPAWVWE